MQSSRKCTFDQPRQLRVCVRARHELLCKPTNRLSLRRTRMHRKTYLWMAIVVILSLLASTTAFAQTGGTPHGAVPVDGDAPTEFVSGVATSGPGSGVGPLA